MYVYGSVRGAILRSWSCIGYSERDSNNQFHPRHKHYKPNGDPLSDEKCALRNKFMFLGLAIELGGYGSILSAGHGKTEIAMRFLHWLGVRNLSELASHESEL